MNAGKTGRTKSRLFAGWMTRATSRRLDRAARVSVERMEERALLTALGADPSGPSRPEPRLDGVWSADPADYAAIAPFAGFGFGLGAASASPGLATPFLRELTLDSLGLGVNAEATAAAAPTRTDVISETEAAPEGTPTTFSAFTRTASGSSVGSQGSVTFFADDEPIGSVPTTNGLARLTTTALTSGRHQIVARYDGAGEFASSESTAIEQQVFDAPPSQVVFGTRVFTPKLPTRVGEPFAVYVKTPFAGDRDGENPSDEGSVRLYINGRAHSAAEVDNGLAMFVIRDLPAGEYAIGARRFSAEGQLLELAASVAHKVYDIPTDVKLPALIWMFADRARDPAGFFTIKGIVGERGATGVVQLWDGDRLLGFASLDQEAVAAFRVNLAPGPRQLRVVYLGDPVFQGASSIVYSTNLP